jgi:hypothetical protein
MNFVDTDDVTATNPTSDLANPDSDGDGVRDYLDIDSDNDGIPDIIESQTTAAYVAPSNQDSDGDGIDDSYDPDNGGSLITPVNTDGLDLRDYLDSDSDNDNIGDLTEGHDANFNGVGDWDANNDSTFNDTGFDTDTDGDGLLDIFDDITLIQNPDSNALGSNAPLQNTDGTDQKDWRDTNDDNDNALTINEDNNTNGNYADDRTNGQLNGNADPPDYLYNGDFDDDGIADALDLDSDNDGIPDAQEDNGESVDPSADADADGIPNFRDPDISGSLSDASDVNMDGIFDVFDADQDGIPDFQDLDSDDDGIPDIVEAGGTDSNGDGLADDLTDANNDGFVDLYNGADTLIVADSDGDGRINTIDLDSDNDGITDLREADGISTIV